MDKSNIIVGLDIGGTYIKYVVKEINKVYTGKEYIHDIKNDSRKLLGKILDILKRFSPEKAGIAIAGLYDLKEEKLTSSPNIRSLENVPIKLTIQESLKIPVVVHNDATMAAYGEYVYGAGKGGKVVVCLTLGTGLGGGAVIDGKPFTGVSGSAMEIGHTTIKVDGFPCHCGRKGCLEAYVSSYGLERLYFLNTDIYRSSFEIINLANEGNKEAMEALRLFSYYLSIGIMNVLHIFNPDKVILSGGIVENYPLLEEMAYSDLKKLAFPLPFRDFELKLAELGEFSGAYGAMALAENTIRNNNV